jgi:hypothetical protein
VRRLLIVAVAILGTGLGLAVAEEEPDHDVRLQTELLLEPGARGTLSLTIAAKAGYSISKEGPLEITMSVEPAGISLPKHRYRRRDSADARADSPRFDLRVRAREAGEFEVVVKSRFWVCRKKTCRPVRNEQRAAITVQTPASDAGPTGDGSTPDA